MIQNKLFRQTRQRLAGSYAVVMGSILCTCGIELNRAIGVAYYQTLDRELESVAGTWHDLLESQLTSTINLETAAPQLLPSSTDKRHLVGVIYRQDYYIRLLNTQGQVIGIFSLQPSPIPPTNAKINWKTLQNERGDRYREISIPMHARGHEFIGYLQMGRSLEQLEQNLAQIQLILILVIAIAMFAAIVSSFWLSSLAMQPIYRSYTQIQQFTADAAHELRTPLAAISATVESALRSPPLGAEGTDRLLNTLKDQNRRLTSLVADLLLLARIDARERAAFKSCYLNDIIADLVEELAPLAVTNQIVLEADVRVKTALCVRGDESQLYRLVSNLIVNAIQHTPSGGRVWVVLKSDRHQAQIQVKDTGVGIPPEVQSHIFDRFYRINSDRSRHSGGTGLGLAIVKAIAENHGGKLHVSSTLGQGSTFTITLPALLEPRAQF